jgi:hypothetical protein
MENLKRILPGVVGGREVESLRHVEGALVAAVNPVRAGLMGPPLRTGTVA